jgi:peptidoglycan/xylan/chitin deacetylase (PgdA/CDA1 family)
MLADGDGIGDHSWDHANLAVAGARAARELTRTNAAIERAAGYRPCLFRAPFGATSPALIAEAGALGMLTVGWDVDPRDWSLPGPDAIVHRILTAAHPGAIVLMHDGGGPREETVAALPRVVAQLRGAGYGFVTVPQLMLSRGIG